MWIHFQGSGTSAGSLGVCVRVCEREYVFFSEIKFCFSTVRAVAKTR